jgi:hypothetical protein
MNLKIPHTYKRNPRGSRPTKNTIKKYDDLLMHLTTFIKKQM